MDQDYLRNAIRRNTIDPVIYYDEEWRKIEFIPNIKPIYWISNYGRVYNETTNYIMDGHIIPNGYELVSFYLIDGTRIWKHVHRLVMLAFKPIENSDMYVVNHIDGIKTHNYIWNLEWTTQKGNVEHAFINGLRKCGEDSSHTVFTNDQVHKVCKCMEDGMNLYQLSEKVFGKYPDLQIQTLCKNIYSKKFWREISKDYDIDNYKRIYIFSKPQVKKICELLEKGLDIIEIIPIIDPNYNNSNYDSYYRTITKIKNKKSFTDISKNFNI